MISEVTGLHSLTLNSDTWRPSESTKGNRKFENSSFQCIITSKTRARRVAEFPAEGMLRYRIQRQGLPIGIGVKPHTFRAWFCEFLLILLRFSSPVPATSQPIAALLRPSLFSQFFSQLFSTAQVFFISSHLSSALFTSSHLFSTLLNDSHLCPPLLNSSQLIYTLLTSCHLFSTLPTSSHLRSTHLTSFSAHLNSPHLLSTLLNSFHRDALNRETFAHKSYTQKLFHRASFYPKPAFTQ